MPLVDKDRLKKALKRSKWALSFAYLVDDSLWRVRHARRRVDSEGGTTHQGLDVAASLAYLDAVFADYRTHGGLGTLRGRAAELGPGDNAGIGVLLRAAGCAEVDLVDRFRSRRDPAHQRAIYQALADRDPRARLWRGDFTDDDALDGIHWHVGVAAETYFRTTPERYALIVSRSVLEHLFDPLGALAAMVDRLEPGGKLVHKVDLRDHGFFTPEGHALRFLEIPSWIYPHLTRYSGRPNRLLVGRYRALLDELAASHAIAYELRVTALAGVGEVAPPVPAAALDPATLTRSVDFVERHRARFAREFRDVPSADLAVQGFFLTVVKSA